MMKGSITSMAGILAVLLVNATVQAELKLVENFDGLPVSEVGKSPDDRACSGVLGGTWDTQSDGTGNIDIVYQDGSMGVAVGGNSQGNGRAIGFNGIANTIDNSETGILFFRFMVRSSGRATRTFIGLTSDTSDNPLNSGNTSDPTSFPAAFRLVDNASGGIDVVTIDNTDVLKAGLSRAQWYNLWIVANNATDTFDLYLSAAAGPAGEAALPNPEDLANGGIPFTIATTDALTGMVISNPSGTSQAETVYFDEVWWDGDQGLSVPKTARSPSPASGETDVPSDVILAWTGAASADKYDVYFGTSRADVDAATTANPLGTLASVGEDANTYDPPGLLEFGRTYYWRVDELSAAPDSTVFQGPVWSFTVEPYAYALRNVTATASSSHNADMGPGKTVDGSGLGAAGLHGTTDSTMWLSSAASPIPAWIQYEFDRVHKLQEMWVWNSNQSVESTTGFGARHVTIEYSTDATDWVILDGAHEFARAPGLPGYEHNTTVDFGGALARYVRLTINSNWGTLPQFGLSEVRFFYLPVLAREPMPAADQMDVEVDAVLSWRSGREAVSHQVSFSADQQAVVDDTAPVRTVSLNRFDPGALNLGTTYYWKVTEVNDAEMPAVWPGAVWSFSTREYLVIDDFESYNDEEGTGTRIYETWIDGWAAATPNGSTVGNWDPPFAEQTIVHGGRQSMPMDYNNTSTPFYSEAYRDWTTPQDWTVNGADTLSLWVRGNPVAYREEAGVITMSGSGHDIWDNADDFRFAHQRLSGNGSITVKVESIVNTNNWAKAGVMIRQDLAADSKFVYVIVSAAQGVSLGWRQLAGSGCDSVTQAGVAAPQWVKLTRTGDVFTAQYSADGTTWLDVKNADGTVASTTAAMLGSVYLGLCVTSRNTAATTTAVFSNATTTGSITGSRQVTAIGDDPQPGNSPGNLYITVQDSANKTTTVTHPTAVTTGAWTEWKIPLSDLAGMNLGKVKRLYIGVGDKANPVSGASGRIYIDDIGYGRPAPQ